MSDFAKEIISVNIEDELKQSYLSYALSVIHGRALPDIRDGLKPVHRRIQLSMMLWLGWLKIFLCDIQLLKVKVTLDL